MSLESLIESFEVGLLHREDNLECSLTLLNCVGADHLTECFDSAFTEEHVLCTAETDTFSTELTSLLSIVRCISVCTYFESLELVSPLHDAAEVTVVRISVDLSDSAVIDLTCRTVEGDDVAFLECLASECELLVSFVHSDLAAAGYAALTHTTCNYCSV